jgi:hypothetical protein
MTVNARRVRVTPYRSASAAWTLIVDLISKPGTTARSELNSIAGTLSAVIASEATRDAPIALSGTGPLVRLFSLHDDSALTDDDADETALASCPTEGEWSMSVPVDDEDLAWVKTALAKHTERVTVRSKDEKPIMKSNSAFAAEALIDMEAFLRP